MAGLQWMPFKQPVLSAGGLISRAWYRFLADTRIQFIGLDTTTGPKTVDLSKLDGGSIVIKDEGGMASTNPITVIGTVEGIIDPVLNANYFTYRIYAHNGLWFTW